MVVKGDGSLLRADFARSRPVETVLSGPAASLSGAAFLAGSKSALVADIGGTTTDISFLQNGTPRLKKMVHLLAGGKPWLKLPKFGLADLAVTARLAPFTMQFRRVRTWSTPSDAIILASVEMAAN